MDESVYPICFYDSYIDELIEKNECALSIYKFVNESCGKEDPSRLFNYSLALYSALIMYEHPERYMQAIFGSAKKLLGDSYRVFLATACLFVKYTADVSPFVDMAADKIIDQLRAFNDCQLIIKQYDSVDSHIDGHFQLWELPNLTGLFIIEISEREETEYLAAFSKAIEILNYYKYDWKSISIYGDWALTDAGDLLNYRHHYQTDVTVNGLKCMQKRLEDLTYKPWMTTLSAEWYLAAVEQYAKLMSWEWDLNDSEEWHRYMMNDDSLKYNDKKENLKETREIFEFFAMRRVRTIYKKGSRLAILKSADIKEILIEDTIKSQDEHIPPVNTNFAFSQSENNNSQANEGAHTTGCFVINHDNAEKVLEKMHIYIDNAPSSKPKDICRPIRAAQDAGVIRKITWNEFCAEFGKEKIKSKTSLNNYLKIDESHYVHDMAFNQIKIEFEQMI